MLAVLSYPSPFMLGMDSGANACQERQQEERKSVRPTACFHDIKLCKLQRGTAVACLLGLGQ